MFTNGIAKHTLHNLELLGKELWVKKFYLAGGTAASLRLGHRYSFDLDYFTPDKFEVASVRQNLSRLGPVAVEHEGPETFLGSLNGERVSFFRYPYPVLFKTELFQRNQIADLRDIACMKIDAISSRGIKRDFMDLYLISQKYPLEDLFKFFEKKFTGTNFSMPHLLRSLSYFADAEESEEPKMIKNINWEEVKKFFISESLRLGKKLFSQAK